MLGLIKKMFIGLLINIVNACNHTKCVSFSNQSRSEYSQEFHCYPFAVKLDRCVGSCNTLNDLCNKVCVPNKTEDLNLRFKSCECKCKFDGRKWNSNQRWNNDKC